MAKRGISLLDLASPFPGSQAILPGRPGQPAREPRRHLASVDDERRRHHPRGRRPADLRPGLPLAAQLARRGARAEHRPAVPARPHPGRARGRPDPRAGRVERVPRPRRRPHRHHGARAAPGHAGPVRAGGRRPPAARHDAAARSRSSARASCASTCRAAARSCASSTGPTRSIRRHRRARSSASRSTRSASSSAAPRSA